MSPGFVLALLALAPLAQRVLEYQQEVEQALPDRRLSKQELLHLKCLYDLNDEQVEGARKNLPWGITPEQQRAAQERTRQQRPQPLPSLPDDPKERARRHSEQQERELTLRIREYYAAVDQQKWGSIPPDQRAGLRVDRWGTVWTKNPHGLGWRELGCDDPYDIKPNSSW